MEHDNLGQTDAGWRVRPLFISGTFRDMHAERDYLSTHVFPELAERLLPLRLHPEPIDLRLGVETSSVTEEEHKQLLVLKVCLEDIERSRPFLIVLLGDRYGWVPPSERAIAAVREKGLDIDVSGKSITALEIEFGVFSKPEQMTRCFFYVREPLPYDEMPAETAAIYSEGHRNEPGAREAAEQLIELKGRIAKEYPERGKSYRAEWNGPPSQDD